MSDRDRDDSPDDGEVERAEAVDDTDSFDVDDADSFDVDDADSFDVDDADSFDVDDADSFEIEGEGPIGIDDAEPTEAMGEDPFDALGDSEVEDPFVEMDTDAETVGDDVFEMVGGDERDAAGLNIERDAAVEEVGDGVVVPKRSYCERCRHFAQPPAMRCTNSGTTIHELVDVEHVYVSNCPVVEEQRDSRAPGE